MASLILFDIDGTLILTARAGLRGMNAAFGRVHGRPSAMSGVAFAGRTDRAIVSDALRGIGVDPTDPEVRRVREAYLEHLPAELERAAPEARGVLPGVWSLLQTLATRSDCHVGLLTGNFEGGAAMKLGHFSLWDAFRFGAFGDDHLDRRDLVPMAIARARAAGVDTGPAPRVVIIGDTPLDVDCAHAHGARAVAVATGQYDADALRRCGADHVVASLETVRIEDL